MFSFSSLEAPRWAITHVTRAASPGGRLPPARHAACSIVAGARATARSAFPAAAAARAASTSGQMPTASPASAAAPSAVASASALTSTGHADQVGLELHEEAVRGRPAVGAQHAGRDRQDIDDVGHLMGHRLERRPHELRARRPARDAADQARAPPRPSAASRGPSARARRRRRRSNPTSRASCSLSAASSISPSPSRSHCSAAPPTSTDPSAANCGRAPGGVAAAVFSRPCGDRPGELADVREDERPGAVGRLHLAGREAALAEERRLLVAGDAGERHGRAEQRSPRRRRRQEGTTVGRIDAVDGEELEQLVVPGPRLEVEQHRARRVREVGDVRRSRRSGSRRSRSRPSRRRAPRCGRVRPARIHSSFVAEKYGSQTRPVRSRTSSAGSSAHRAAVRRSCQTIAGCTGRPLARSHTTVVSRWFVIPIAPSSSAPIPASASAAAAVRRTLSQSSSGIVLDPARPGIAAARSRGSRARRPAGRRRRRGRSCPSCPGRWRGASCRYPTRRSHERHVDRGRPARRRAPSRSSGSVPRTARQRRPAAFADATPASVSSNATRPRRRRRRAARRRAGSPRDAASRARRRRRRRSCSGRRRSRRPRRPARSRPGTRRTRSPPERAQPRSGRASRTRLGHGRAARPPPRCRRSIRSCDEHREQRAVDAEPRRR